VIATGAGIPHSSRGGRNSDRKKIFSDYPRVSLRCWLLPLSDTVAVTPVLPVAFFFARRRRPVTLLSFPARPLPRGLPALPAAIALARLAGMKTLVTAFQQTTAGARTAGRAFPPAAVFLIGRACRILVRAHGRVAPGKLMPWRGLVSSPGRSRSGSVRTQNSIAEEPVPSGFACGLLFPARGGAAAKRVSQPSRSSPVGSRIGTSRSDLSIRPGSHLPDFFL
jgi:hypothetical protein